jgi:hypothetical protein
MRDLPKFKAYPKLLWDYLPDMPYMPPAEDREHVLKRAKTVGQEHRIQIWDYFFRPRSEHVGIPIRMEISNLEADIPQLSDEASQVIHANRQRISNLEIERENKRKEIQARLLQKEKEITDQQRREGNAALTIGIGMAGASILAAMYLAAIEADCLWVLYIFLGLPLLFIGAMNVVRGWSILSLENIAKKVHKAQEELRKELENLESRIKSAIAAAEAACGDPQWVLDKLIPHLQSRLEEMLRQLQSVLDQIPTPPQAEVVEGWLQNDLEELIETGSRQLGVLPEQLKAEYDGENPIVLLGPAELQGASEIPPVCFKGGRDRYLNARRIGRTNSGLRFQHYGIFCAELLYITPAALGRFSVFFDFVRGESLSERAPLQHYADVVILEIRKEFREILIDGKQFEILHAPSIRLSLKSADQITITLPNDEYFQAAGLVNYVASASDYDASRTAENAMRAIRFKVDESKKKLEISDLSRH